MFLFIALFGLACLLALLYEFFIGRKRQPLDIFASVKHGKLQVVSKMTEQKSPDHFIDDESNTPLMIACREDQLEIAKLLFSRGASVMVRNIHQFTPLHMACYNEASDELVRFLISNDAQLEAVDQNGWTPLHMAASKSCTRLVKILLEKKANIDAQNLAGQTSLLIASNNGALETVKLLLLNRANTTLRTKKSLDSPLLLAAVNGHDEVAKVLIEANRDLLSLASHDGSIPLHGAVARKNISMIKLLMSYGTDIGTTKRDGSNALHIAVNIGDVDFIKELLALGCPFEARDAYGSTPLHRACTKKRADITLLLLEKGASAQAIDNDRLTPLHVLCSSSVPPEKCADPEDNVKILQALLLSGLDIRARDRVGASALHSCVCRKWNINLMKAMLATDIELAFICDNTKRTPLHLLMQAYPSHTELTEELTGLMKKHKPSFFDNFDPKHIERLQNDRIESNLSDEERLDVLGGDVSLKGVAQKILSGKIKNIVVLTGAGISTSSGIPDFRTPGSGIYSDPELAGTKGNSSFSLSTFAETPDQFFGVLRKVFLPVIQGKFKPTLCHRFISLLHSKGLLLRNYTQNIDTLEAKAGIPPEKLVLAHGSLDGASCPTCGKACTNMAQFWSDIEKDELPICQHCARSGRKSLLKPDVVLFGEPLPAGFFDHQREDFKQCDLLIVMGTSLKVYPFAGLVNSVSDKTARLLINKEAVGAFTKGAKEDLEEGKYDNGLQGTYRDIAFLGDIDVGVAKLAEYLGWTDELKDKTQ